jgi:hypothetical protein
MQYALTGNSYICKSLLGFSRLGLGLVANEFCGKIPCNLRNPIHQRFCLFLSASRIKRMEGFRGFLSFSGCGNRMGEFRPAKGGRDPRNSPLDL